MCNSEQECSETLIGMYVRWGGMRWCVTPALVGLKLGISIPRAGQKVLHLEHLPIYWELLALNQNRIKSIIQHSSRHNYMRGCAHLSYVPPFLHVLGWVPNVHWLLSEHAHAVDVGTGFSRKSSWLLYFLRKRSSGSLGWGILPLWETSVSGLTCASPKDCPKNPDIAPPSSTDCMTGIASFLTLVNWVLPSSLNSSWRTNSVLGLHGKKHKHKSLLSIILITFWALAPFLLPFQPSHWLTYRMEMIPLKLYGHLYLGFIGLSGTWCITWFQISDSKSSKDCFFCLFF